MRRSIVPLVLGPAAVVLAAVVVVTAVRTSEERPASSRPVPSSPGLVAPSPEDEPLPLGTTAPARFDAGRCPADHACEQVSVSCPGLRESARVTIATAEPTAPSRGVAVFLSGGGGRGWWADEGSTDAFLGEVRGAGLAVVQVRWKDEWLGAAAGERAGPHRLACRPATVLRRIHDRVYPRFGAADPVPGTCGFCITGSSGGASQLAYALSFYGLDAAVDVAVPTGGPPHAALAKGCRRDGGDRAYWYVGASTQTIDTSWGFRGGGGPCVGHDDGWTAEWDRASVDLGGTDYDHETTHVHVLIGERDPILPHARDYIARLRAAGSPVVELEIVPAMGHGIARSPNGLGVLLDVLTR